MTNAREINAAATFLPATDNAPYPGVMVAGVMVLAYVDETGTLIISADFDTSELGEITPVKVTMSGETVWSVS